MYPNFCVYPSSKWTFSVVWSCENLTTWERSSTILQLRITWYLSTSQQGYKGPLVETWVHLPNPIDWNKWPVRFGLAWFLRSVILDEISYKRNSNNINKKGPLFPLSFHFFQFQYHLVHILWSSAKPIQNQTGCHHQCRLDFLGPLGIRHAGPKHI